MQTKAGGLLMDDHADHPPSAFTSLFHPSLPCWLAVTLTSKDHVTLVPSYSNWYCAVATGSLSRPESRGESAEVTLPSSWLARPLTMEGDSYCSAEQILYHSSALADPETAGAPLSFLVLGCYRAGPVMCSLLSASLNQQRTAGSSPGQPFLGASVSLSGVQADAEMIHHTG